MRLPIALADDPDRAPRHGRPGSSADRRCAVSRLAIARAASPRSRSSRRSSLMYPSPRTGTRSATSRAPRWATYFIAILGLNIVTGLHGPDLARPRARSWRSAATRPRSSSPSTASATSGRSRSRRSSRGSPDSSSGVPALRLSGPLPRARHVRARASRCPTILSWDKLDAVTKSGHDDPALQQPAPDRQGLRGRDLPRAHAALQPRRLLPDLGASRSSCSSSPGSLLRGAPGRAFRAVRDSEVAADLVRRPHRDVQDACVRDQRRLRGNRRLAARDRGRLRRPAVVPGQALAHAPRRRGRRGARIAVGRARWAPRSSSSCPTSPCTSRRRRACPTRSTARR